MGDNNKRRGSSLTGLNVATKRQIGMTSIASNSFRPPNTQQRRLRSISSLQIPSSTFTTVLTAQLVLAVFLSMFVSDTFSLPTIPDQGQYFYYDTTGHHVQEYVSDQVISNGGKNLGQSIDRPDFLYKEDYPNARIVEFYAHWCPHCKHFKPKYMEFSNKIYSMTSSSAAKMPPQPIVEVFAVSCVPNKNLCGRQSIKGYPTVMVYPPKSINGTKINHGSLHPMEIMRMVGIEEQKQQKINKLTQKQVGPTDKKQEPISAEAIDAHNLQGDPLSNPKHINNEDKNVPRDEIIVFMSRSKQEVFEDAHLSMSFAMRTAVFNIEGPLPKQRRDVLKRFLQVLQKTLPLHSSLHHVVYDLIEQFDYICEDDKNLNEIIDKHPPPVNQWSPASRLHGTGYTAGLWQLFHIMTVGAVEWNRMSVMDEQRLNVAAVAETLRDYIQNFFQCDVCRLHFMSEYDACSYDRCNRLIDKKTGTELKDWIQLPLWLYETHNAVNVRLRKERIELHDETDDQTAETDVMWPPDEDCPSCWLSPGRWDEKEVYNYLHEIYWYEESDEIMSKNDDDSNMMAAAAKSISTSSSPSSLLSFGSLPWPSWISYSALIVIVVIYLIKNKGLGKNRNRTE